MPRLDKLLSIVRQVDRQARFKSIISQQGVSPDGSSAHWEFFFDLPQRLAHLVSEWKLSWDESKDAFGPDRISILANPFPPLNSPLNQMVKVGKLLHSLSRTNLTISFPMLCYGRDRVEQIRTFIRDQCLDRDGSPKHFTL
jgi:hypothetical protein